MRRSRILTRRVVLSFATVGALACVLCSAAPALATVGWAVRSIADPTRFAPSDATECSTAQEKCDRYHLIVLNTGDSASSTLQPVTITDRLPTGLTTLASGLSEKMVESTKGPNGEVWECPEANHAVSEVKCTLSGSIAGGAYAPVILIPVTAPTETSGTLVNKATVEGGETSTTPAAAVSEETEISPQAPPFGVTGFSFEALNADGTASGGAGARPGVVLANIAFPTVLTPPGTGNPTKTVRLVEQVKNVVVELPAGFVGDPRALPRCPQSDLGGETEVTPGTAKLEETCASIKSEVGVVAFDDQGAINSTGEGPTSRVYNVVPEAGYPAEFGFTYFENGVNMYASVAHNSSGYRLRVAAPGVTTTVGLASVQLAFFGDAARRDGLTPSTAFLTNPADCSEGPLEAKVEADSWEHPETWVSKTTVSYPQIEGCNLLQFEPRLEMAPARSSGEGEGSSQADEPSAYDVNLEVPQKSLFEESATPDLKDASVTLPEGVSVSPSAANGLEGCEPTGPNGIDLPSGNRLPDEAGEGEEIGADGLSHLVAGHCPKASTLGTVEITTPLLEEPLKGHVYLAQPKCGGAGQPACTEASATNGELYGLYIEAAGSGVVVKLPGTVSANPSTGQLTGAFSENPQLPFSDLRIHFRGGARAPIANPQACGSYATSSTLTSWAGQGEHEPKASPPFSIDWDGKGGACPSGMPFAPGFSAGTTGTQGGAFSPFLLSFSRQDREQDLSGLSVTLPPGLLAKIAGVPLCGETQADAGTCGPESQLGSASALAGPGADPLYVSGGRVYLTTGYGGGPFGLSIVVPAVAGPFNLGNVVVRAAIHVNPETAQVTVTTDPLPQSRDGVPFRLRAVYTEINRPGFTFNPTNCAQQQVTGTIAGSRGASASVSSPFAATGCAGLAFKPSFTASTAAKTSKAEGASLVVKVAQKPGEADIRKVDLTLPKILPARLTTLHQACTEARFAANPAACPPGSFIGTATAVTPVLNVALQGPAILVSHGGAAFPDVEFVLQGEGVQIVLDGKTDIKAGVTYSKFETVPDAPISSFETTLPEGPHSVLTTEHPGSTNLCATTKTVTVKEKVVLKRHGHAVRRHGHVVHVTRMVERRVAAPLTMPTTITGQNGAQIVQSTRIFVTGCAKAKAALTRAQKLAKALKACRERAKDKRARCQKRARKEYGPVKARAKKKKP